MVAPSDERCRLVLKSVRVRFAVASQRSLRALKHLVERLESRLRSSSSFNYCSEVQIEDVVEDQVVLKDEIS